MDSRILRDSRLLDKKYWQFFVPTILMAMTTTMSIVVDSIIVGNMLGSAALAAVNLVLPVMMVYVSVAVLLGLGAATAISIAFGKRQEQYARELFTSAIVAMLVVSGLLVAGQAVFLDQITALLTRDASLAPLVRAYLHVLIYGAPVIIVPLGLVYCLRADGWVRMASAMLIAANVINLILDLVYMGPLNMGIAGSSLATVSGYTAGAFLLPAYAFGRERNLGLVLSVCARPLLIAKHLRTIVSTGAPAAMSTVLTTIKLLAINTIVMHVAGKSGMIAFSVCLSCLSFISMFISGAAQAMTPIAGFLFGEGDYLGVRFVVRRAVWVLLLAVSAAVLLLEAFPETVLWLFGIRDAEIMAAGVPAVRLFAISLPGTSFSYLAMYYYMTIGRKKLSTAISIVQGLLVVVPVAYLLSAILGVNGVWIAFSLAELSTMLLIVVWYKRLKARAPGKYLSILLLDHERFGDQKVFEASGAGTPEDADVLLRNITDFMDQSGLKAETVRRLQAGIREMVLNIVHHAYSGHKRGVLDIRILCDRDTVRVCLRDSGKQFNPKARMAELDTDGCGLGRVKSAVTVVDYSRIIGFNNTTLIFEQEQ